jgi:hypothetical protein
MPDLLLLVPALASLLLLIWAVRVQFILWQMQRDLGYAPRRRGSNPPPRGRKPAAGQSPIRFDEGQTQRGNGNGVPTTSKPPIKPEPHGGRQLPHWP